MALTLMKGSEAIAEAAIRAGARFFFGYPITPQTEIPEYMSARMPEVGGCFRRPRARSRRSTWCTAPPVLARVSSRLLPAPASP